MDFDRLMKYQQYREKYEDLYNKVDKAIINYIERDDIKRQIERRMMDYERYTKLSNTKIDHTTVTLYWYSMNQINTTQTPPLKNNGKMQYDPNNDYT